MWNLRTFKLYNNDLWGTLLLSSSFTRPMKYLLKLRFKTRFYNKSLYEGHVKRRIRANVRFKFFDTFFKRFTRKKGYHSVRGMRVDKVSSLTRALRYSHLYAKYRRARLSKSRKSKNIDFSTGFRVWSWLSIVFRNRYQFSSPRFFDKRRNGKKSYSRRRNNFIVDYTKPKTFDKLRIRLKRRTFNSQRIIELRKFRKFYFTVGQAQFCRSVSRAKIASKYGASLLDSALSALERRLDVALFRSNLATSLFMAKHLISYGHICVNYFPVKRSGYTLTNCELVSVAFDSINLAVDMAKKVYLKRWIAYASLSSKKRSKHKLVVLSLFLPTSYMEIDFKSFSFILIADVFSKNIFYPFKISFYNLNLYLNRIRSKVK